MENLVNDLTQKDEAKACAAAKTLINTKNCEAFKKLCDKSEFLFDFVKNNVRKRLKNAVTPQNFKNLTAFFEIYNENYADLFIESISKYADEELTDGMYELLENGSVSQKTYAAKYFSYIPDTIAAELLEKYAFSEDLQLAVNSAQALGAMKQKTAYEKAIAMLDENDDFKVMQSAKFLVSYGDKNAVPKLLKTVSKSSLGENIAGEIPYLMTVLDMFEKQDFDDVLTCLDFILLGLGEILPLSSVFDYEIFECVQYLLQKAEIAENSHTSAVLLRALEKFSILTSSDEYIFDESKDVKQEIQAIYDLLNTQGQDFWKAQEQIVPTELAQSKQRAISALELIKALEIQSAEGALLDFTNTQTDEQLLLLALSAAKVLNIISKINSAEFLAKVSDSTAKAISASYFM